MTLERAGHSKADLAYETIRDRIADGTYPPGHRLVLTRLAGDLAISSLPVREALRRLEAEGMVDFTRNIGAVVASIDQKEYVETLQVLAILEGVATAESAPNLSSEQLLQARTIIAEQVACQESGDLRRYTQLNRSFHELVCSACPNTYLRTTVARIEAIRRSAFRMMPSRLEQSIAEHTRIVDLIEAGASYTEIERVAREHKLNTLRTFTSADSTATDFGAPRLPQMR